MKRFFVAAICSLLSFVALLAGESKTPSPVKPNTEEHKDAPKEPGKEPDKDPAPEDPPAKEKSARYKFPKEADSDALVDFCQKLQDYEPEDDADAKRHEKKMPRAIKKACKRIVELETDEESDNARFARRMLLAMKLDSSRELDEKKIQKLIARASVFLASPNVSAEDSEVASALADFLGDHVSPKSIEWCKKVGTELSANADHDLAAAGKVLLGTARRLALVGQPLPLIGTTVDGKPFDISSLKDKVVLVMFWASWCDHCVAEISNIKPHYETYHAKGFEVVAIAGDEDRGELLDFLKLEQIPWINLYEKGGNHPAVDQFGINGFPTTILIGKDGKVTALNVRDKALGDELQKLLGAVEGANELKKAEPPKSKTPTDDDDNDSGESLEKLKKKYSF